MLLLKVNVLKIARIGCGRGPYINNLHPVVAIHRPGMVLRNYTTTETPCNGNCNPLNNVPKFNYHDIMDGSAREDIVKAMQQV